MKRRLGPTCKSPLGRAAPPAIYADLLRDVGSSPTATIAEVPIIVGKDQISMYYSTFHWQTLLNGYSGGFPPTYLRLAGAMCELTLVARRPWQGREISLYHLP